MIIKINPFAQIIEAFRGFSDTSAFFNLRKQSTGSKIAYSFIISILAGLLLCILTAFSINHDKDLESMIQAMPEFYYTNGTLTCEQSYDLPVQDKYLILDCSVPVWDEDILNQQINGTATTGYAAFQKGSDNPSTLEIMLISNTNIATYKKYTGQLTVLPLSDFFGVFGIQALSKQIILDNYKGFVWKVAMLCSIFVIPYRYVALFLMSLILSIIALIINAVLGSKEKFTTIYWISFYMQSVIVLIKIIGSSALNMNDTALNIACVLFFCVMMYRTLRDGEPAPATSTNVYRNDDDFEAFMRDTAPNPSVSPIYTSPASTSAFDTPKAASTSFESSQPTTSAFETPQASTFKMPESSTSYSEPANTTASETQKSSSGLSLRLDD